MDICIVKGASRQHYFMQNMQLLRMRTGDQFSISYRSRWVDTALINTDGWKRCSGIIVLCDKPAYGIIAVRRVEVYDAEITKDSFTLHARCGHLVNADESADWSDEFRAKYPTAGMETGLFVMPLHDLALCQLADSDRQESAWRGIVRQLASVPAYQRSYFFYDRGVTEEDGETPVLGALDLGRTYKLTGLSYNKHIDSSTRKDARIHVTSDETILAAQLDESLAEGLPDYKHFNVTLVPIAEGATRLELGVLGSYNETSRIHLHLECKSHGHDSPPSTFPDLALESDFWIKWRLYLRVRAVCQDAPDKAQLLVSILNEIFSAEELVNRELAQEKVTQLAESGDMAACAELADDLPEGQIANMWGPVKERLFLAVCKTRHSLPTVSALWRDVNLGPDGLGPAFRDLVQSLKPEHAAKLVGSMLAIKDREGGANEVSAPTGLNIDDSDIGQLLLMGNVRSGHETLPKVQKAVRWLRQAELYYDCYEFLMDRFEAVRQAKDCVELLEAAVISGCECDGREATSLLQDLLSHLINSGRGEQAISHMRTFQSRLPLLDHAHLLAGAAEVLNDATTQACTYLECVEECSRTGELESAKEYMRHAVDAAARSGDIELKDMVDKERSRLEADNTCLETQADSDRIGPRFRHLYPSVVCQPPAIRELERMGQDRLLGFEREIALFQHNQSAVRFRDVVINTSYKEIGFDGDGRAYATVEGNTMTVHRIGSKATQSRDIRWLRQQKP